MKATNNNIYTVLSDLCVSKNTVSWKQIVNEINNSGMKITNWLKVRGVLQYMIKNKTA